MKKLYVAIFSILFIGLTPGAMAASLGSAVQQAISTNPDIGVVLSDKDIAEGDLSEARAGFYPSVDLQANAGREHTDSPSTRSNASDPDPSLNRKEASLTLRQLLFDGFGVWNEVKRRKALLASSENRVKERSEQIALDAIEAYLEVLRRNRLVQLAEENLARHESTLDMVQRRAEGGGGSVADVRQAEARLGNAQTILTQVEQNLSDAEATYQRVVGVRPDELTRPNLEGGALPSSLDAAIARAIDNNPSVLSAKTDLDAADAAVSASNAPFSPRFDLELRGRTGSDLDGLRGDNDQTAALVVARWNLFRGGADAARKRSNIARQMRAKDVIARTQRVAAEQSRLAWNALTSARGRVASLRNVVEANERVREAYGQQFELSQRSLLDLLDSENELFLSRSDLVTAEYTALFGGYRLLGAMGTLLNHLNIPVPADKQVAAR